jgi:hypothetical protein
MGSALLLISASILATAPAFAETRTYNVNSFSKLDISAGYEVQFTQAPQRSVTVESDNFDRIIVEQRGDTLRVACPRNTNLRGKVRDIVRISAPELDEVQLNAGVKFRVDGLNVDDLTLDINAGVNASFQRVSAKSIELDAAAGVDVELDGTCESIRVDASAGVKVDASQLKCRSADVDADAGSSVRVHSSERIVADAGVGASIRVGGSPKTVDKQASLGGSVSLVP